MYTVKSNALLSIMTNDTPRRSAVTLKRLFSFPDTNPV